MTNASSFTIPRQAVEAMVEAGAHFTVRQRADRLGASFTYHVGEAGDLNRCREILAAAKAKPSAFFEAFKAQVQDLLREQTIVPSKGVVETTPPGAVALKQNPQLAEVGK